MPNVIHLLKHDHRTVEQLFEDFESSRAQAAVKRICDELTIHAQVEEEIVYPLLQKLDADMGQEHQTVKQLVTEIRATEEGDERQVELMTKLKEAVEHHVGEEEAEAFPKLEDQSGDQLDELAVQVMERRQQLLAAAAPT